MVIVYSIVLLTANLWATEPSGQIIVNESQPLKASSAIFVTEEGMVTALSAVQFANASSPIVVTESGIVIELRLEQP